MSRRKKRKACCGKRTYSSQERAEAVLSTIWAGMRPGRKLEARAYQCAEGGWHLTSQPRRAAS